MNTIKKNRGLTYTLNPNKDGQQLLDSFFVIKRQCWNFCLAKWYDLEFHYEHERKAKYKEVPAKDLIKHIKAINEKNRYAYKKVSPYNVRFLNKPIAYKKTITRLYKEYFLNECWEQDGEIKNRNWQVVSNSRFFDLMIKDSFDKAFDKFWSAVKDGTLNKLKAKYMREVKVNGKKFSQKRFESICKPKFKSRSDEHSFSTDIAKGGAKIDLENGLIWIHKSYKPIKFRIKPTDKIFSYKDLKVKSFTFKRSRAMKYEVTIKFEYIEKELPKVEPVRKLGIDGGCKNALTLSDGRVINYPTEKIERLEYQKEKLQDKANNSYLENKGKKDWNRKNQRKIYDKISKLNRRITKIKDHYLHNLINDIVKNYDFIAFENNTVSNMTRKNKAKVLENGSFAKNGAAMKRGFNRKFLGNRIFKTKTILKYKTEDANKYYAETSARKAASKTCCCCGEKTKLSLSDREWECFNCGVYHNRDLNASINILLDGVYQSEIPNPNFLNPFVSLDENLSMKVDFFKVRKGRDFRVNREFYIKTFSPSLAEVA